MALTYSRISDTSTAGTVGALFFKSARHASCGIRILGERARALGGDVSLCSWSGGTTTRLSLWLPPTSHNSIVAQAQEMPARPFLGRKSAAFMTRIFV